MKVERVFDCHCGTQPILMGSSTNDTYVTNYWFCCPKCGMRNKESGNQFDLDPEEKATSQWNKMIIEHRGKMYARFKALGFDNSEKVEDEECMELKYKVGDLVRLQDRDILIDIGKGAWYTMAMYAGLPVKVEIVRQNDHPEGLNYYVDTMDGTYFWVSEEMISGRINKRF